MKTITKTNGTIHFYPRSNNLCDMTIIYDDYNNMLRMRVTADEAIKLQRAIASDGMAGIAKILSKFPEDRKRIEVPAPLKEPLRAYMGTTEKGRVSIKVPLPDSMRNNYALKEKTIRRWFKKREHWARYFSELPIEFNLTELCLMLDDGTPLCHIGDSTDWNLIEDFNAAFAQCH